jgi:hypothetical protein
MATAAAEQICLSGLPVDVMDQPMRLTRQQQETICETIAEADPGARTFLFGSRAVSTARGGDIDLLCFSQKIDRQCRRKIRRTLQDRLGNQKVDFVVAQDESSPFVRLVLPKAIRLK